MDAFARRKADTLAELAIDGGDFSRAGHVDERARPVVALVNRHPDFFTTSSCAGRVSVFADPTTATRAAGMKGGEWGCTSTTTPADAADVLAAVRSKLGASDAAGASAPDPECTLVLRFEPFILSVEAKTTRAGAALVAAARDAGYRESGVTACDRRTIIAVRCSIRVEVPIVSRGVRLVSEDALVRLVEIANEKHALNAARMERFVVTFAKAFGADPRARGERGGAGDAGATAGRERGGRRGGGTRPRGAAWVYTVDKNVAKRCKDALKANAWLDKTRKAGRRRRRRRRRRWRARRPPP